ncbi:hypothetical protein FOQG_01382 [Fusarium oxysporum f. sp. raphani 54005]|uniref:Uncharacterized protein n=2 Tax=Fusarium oxysporum TaxID=5507 RepID=X0CWD2_FUSOX|nr:hypothetical protein FOVG_09227 [Fusarium oxysporum f. sp. pisi HDV247]EXK98481.1 hypothetical protein FOQG_01382 [Fusarium oxysporum f. sp. raphani 54005]
MEKQARQGSFWGWDAVRSKRGITQGEQARAEIQIAEKKGEEQTGRVWIRYGEKRIKFDATAPQGENGEHLACT